MGHLIVSLVLFAGVMLFTAVLFVVWFLIGMFRMAVRFFVGCLPQPRMASGGLVCGNPRCVAAHPATAKFCRRCGRELAVAQGRIPMGRAAMW